MKDTLKKIEEAYEEFIRAARYRLDGNKSAGRRSRIMSMELTRQLKTWRQKSVDLKAVAAEEEDL